MNGIKIICVGKLKEDYLSDAVNELCRNLSRWLAPMDLIMKELPDEKAPEDLSVAGEKSVKDKEGAAILKNIDKSDYAVALAINGKFFSSGDFLGLVKNKLSSSGGWLVFIIGGTLGLSDSVLKRADISISFSKMTYPHQLMRVILLEQLYRAV